MCIRDRHSNLPGTGEGTGEWKSCFAERCDPLGRRDDMEALGFVLLKLSCGELPWEEDAAPKPAMSQAEELKAQIDELSKLIAAEKEKLRL